VVTGTSLFLNLINNLGILIVLIAGYSLIYRRLHTLSFYKRQIIYGIYFGIFAIGCMQITIVVAPGVFLDQRNTIVLLSGFFCGPVTGVVGGIIAIIYRLTIGGAGALGESIGIAGAALSGSILYYFHRKINTIPAMAATIILPALLILPSLMLVDLHKDMTLFNAAVIPYGLAMYAGFFLVGYLLAKEERREIIRERLRSSEKRYRELFESLVDVYYRTDRNDICEIISPSIEKVCGYQPREIIGKPVAELFKEKILSDDFNSILRKNESVKNFEAEIRKKDGSSIWASINAQSLKDDKGNFSGTEGIVRDISATKILEKEKRQRELVLRQNQKMESIGTLAGGIAHDFNNILAAIIGYAEMALQKVDKSNPLGQDILGIIRSASRAKDLVRHILIFSRRTSYDAGPVEMYLMIKEVIKMIQASLSDTIAVEQVIKCRNGIVLADPTEIHQVILNLCANATEAMDGMKGVITITLEKQIYSENDLITEPELKPGPFITLSIKDTGIGILPANINRVFDPFYTTKEIGKGSGLGLSVVHGIVKRLGGFTTVESTPGFGTAVKIALPEITAQSNGQNNEHEVLPSGNERILFVDDEPIVVDVTKKILEQLGYQVTDFASSKEALFLFKEHPDLFDLVITDQTMPGISGEQLSKELLAIRADIPIIMCTGYSLDIDAEKAKNIGIKDYVMKPIDKKNLATIVRKALDTHPVHA
jgi:PAS domain S-box-containing protein